MATSRINFDAEKKRDKHVMYNLAFYASSCKPNALRGALSTQAGYTYCQVQGADEEVNCCNAGNTQETTRIRSTQPQPLA
jgi:hypothetical protein